MKKYKDKLIEKTPSGKVYIEYLYKSGLVAGKGINDLAQAKTNLIHEVRDYLKSEQQRIDPLICVHCYQPNIKKGFVVYCNDAFKIIPKMFKLSKLKIPFKIINKACKEWVHQKRAILYAINEEDKYII